MRKGFTLIEMLVVVAVVGILATSILVVLDDPVEETNLAVLNSTYRSLGSASQIYFATNGSLDGFCQADKVAEAIERIKEKYGFASSAAVCELEPDKASFSFSVIINNEEYSCTDSSACQKSSQVASSGGGGSASSGGALTSFSIPTNPQIGNDFTPPRLNLSSIEGTDRQSSQRINRLVSTADYKSGEFDLDYWNRNNWSLKTSLENLIYAQSFTISDGVDLDSFDNDSFHAFHGPDNNLHDQTGTEEYSPFIKIAECPGSSVPIYLNRNASITTPGTFSYHVLGRDVFKGNNRFRFREEHPGGDNYIQFRFQTYPNKSPITSIDGCSGFTVTPYIALEDNLIGGNNLALYIASKRDRVVNNVEEETVTVIEIPETKVKSFLTRGFRPLGNSGGWFNIHVGSSTDNVGVDSDAIVSLDTINDVRKFLNDLKGVENLNSAGQANPDKVIIAFANAGQLSDFQDPGAVITPGNLILKFQGVIAHDTNSNLDRINTKNKDRKFKIVGESESCEYSDGFNDFTQEDSREVVVINVKENNQKVCVYLSDANSNISTYTVYIPNESFFDDFGLESGTFPTFTPSLSQTGGHNEGFIQVSSNIPLSSPSSDWECTSEKFLDQDPIIINSGPTNVDYSANTSNFPRSCKVTFTHATNTDYTRTFEIHQEAQPYIQVTGITEEVSVGASGDSFNVGVSTNREWILDIPTNTENMFTIGAADRQGGPGSASQNFVHITVKANNEAGSESREGKLVFKTHHSAIPSRENETPATIEIEVTQAGSS